MLSLFFIDAVEQYRSYDCGRHSDQRKVCRDVRGRIPQGRGQAEYQTLFKDVDLKSDAEEVHDGYFSIDKKGNGPTQPRTTKAIAKTPSAPTTSS